MQGHMIDQKSLRDRRKRKSLEFELGDRLLPQGSSPGKESYGSVSGGKPETPSVTSDLSKLLDKSWKGCLQAGNFLKIVERVHHTFHVFKT
ncbi:hypothetical protein Tco_0858165 [Tanacetum coccineum]|uniref:Uncharacterized protein n=1 Tax=Tanacetum coccineum TaxID=301880 RepID=A0ABQ5B9D5_9ASTR